MSPASLSPTVKPDEEQAQASVLKTLLATTQHFFGGFTHLFAGVCDPRRPELITYPLAAVLFTGVLMFVCRLGARRQIGLMFRDNAPSASKFEALFQVAGCPHGDTLDATFSRLQPAEVQTVVTGLTETLIRCKVLYPDRLLGHYYLVAIDGTGMLVFAERHCAQCLTRTRDGVTIYYHSVLEAKLVTARGFVLSLMTEFIENPGEYPTKQDCELKAFYGSTAPHVPTGRPP